MMDEDSAPKAEDAGRLGLLRQLVNELLNTCTLPH